MVLIRIVKENFTYICLQRNLFGVSILLITVLVLIVFLVVILVQSWLTAALLQIYLNFIRRLILLCHQMILKVKSVIHNLLVLGVLLRLIIIIGVIFVSICKWYLHVFSLFAVALAVWERFIDAVCSDILGIFSLNVALVFHREVISALL